MAIKTVLATTPTTATISVSGDLTFDNFVDIDIDVDTLGRDETATNPEVLINQVDYDINAGSGLGARVERVTEPNPTVVLRIASTAGVGTIENQGQILPLNLESILIQASLQIILNHFLIVI